MYPPPLLAAFPVGELCALGAAIVWATALVLFKMSERVAPLSLSLFKNVIGLVLLLVTLPLSGEAWIGVFESPGSDLALLVVSGVIGIAVADSLLLISLRTIGVGMLTIVECTYTPTVVVLSWLLLGQELAGHHYLGAALVLAGVLTSTTLRPPVGVSRGRLIGGMAIGGLAIVLMAVAIVAVTPILHVVPLIGATTLRLAGGTLVLAAWMAASPRRREYFSIFRPGSVWKTCVPASILSTYLSMVLWVAGFKYAPAAVAAVLNQTSMVFALLLATLVLAEPFSRRKRLAAALTFIGVLVLMLGDRGGSPQSQAAANARIRTRIFCQDVLLCRIADTPCPRDLAVAEVGRRLNGVV